MSRARDILRDKRGAALAEAAIALPVLALIFLGITALGAMFFNSQLIETAARDGARYLSRTDDPVASEAAARNMVVFADPTGAGSPRIPGLTTGDVTISYQTVANPTNGSGERTYRGGATIRIVRVEVDWNTTASGFSAFLGQDSITYRAVNEQRVIGD